MGDAQMSVDTQPVTWEMVAELIEKWKRRDWRLSVPPPCLGWGFPPPPDVCESCDRCSESRGT